MTLAADLSARRESLDSARAPTFVVGAGRSGTTLLRLMLCAHPRIYVAQEGTFYFWEHLAPGRLSARELVDGYLASRSFGWLRIDPERVRAALPVGMTRAQLGLAWAAVMREKAAQYGRVRFGDKTPAHSFYLKRVFRDFPEARVIRVVRDPRATAESLTRVPFGSASVLANCSLLLEHERRRTRVYRDRMLTIRLEDLLANARGVMGRVLDFVGEPWDDAVLDHPRHIPDGGDMPPLPWHASAAGERTAPNERWRGLPPAQIRLIEWAARGCMAEGGYARAELEREPGRLALAREGWRQLHEMLRYARVTMRVLGGDPFFRDPDVANTILHELNPGSWRRYPSLEGQMLPAPPPNMAAPMRGARA